MISPKIDLLKQHIHMPYISWTISPDSNPDQRQDWPLSLLMLFQVSSAHLARREMENNISIFCSLYLFSKEWKEEEKPRSPLRLSWRKLTHRHLHWLRGQDYTRKVLGFQWRQRWPENKQKKLCDYMIKSISDVNEEHINRIPSRFFT